MQIDKLLTTDSADGLTSYIFWNIWRSLGYFYPPNVSLMIDVTADIATKPRYMGPLPRVYFCKQLLSCFTVKISMHPFKQDIFTLRRSHFLNIYILN